MIFEKRMRELNISFTDLARETGKSRSYLYLMSKEGRGTQDCWQKVSAILKCAVEDIYVAPEYSKSLVQFVTENGLQDQLAMLSRVTFNPASSEPQTTEAWSTIWQVIKHDK